MTKAKTPPRKVLLDTNCFLRIYHSPVLPLMQQVVQGHQLLTLKELGKELFESRRLTSDYPWIAKDPKASDIKAGYLQVRGITSSRVEDEKKWIRPYATATLDRYCAERRIHPAKRLSAPDIALLASAVTVKAVIATDEWPLRLVVESLLEDPDDDGDTYEIALMSSLDILALLEAEGLLTVETRVQTVDAWMRRRENLLRGWQQDYERLFGMKPPVLD